ncbi:MAG: hypothetical protein N3G21_04485 [Candidatus Hydrogenedentes bacterium]|nr:hypothetical protein [Candidatus Hydrogenedentota bacterium]
MNKFKVLIKIVFTLSFIGIFTVPIITLTSCYRGYQCIYVDGEKRYYRIHIPENISLNEKVPLLLALHQFSDTARGMEKLTKFNELADKEKFIVVYPQGRWRIWRTDPLPNKDTRFLDVLINQLCDKHPIDTNRIFATGASAGGMMIQAYACYSSNLSGIAPVMGSMIKKYGEERTPAKKIPVLIIHGTSDPIVPYYGGETDSAPGRTNNFMSAEENIKWWAEKYNCLSPPDNKMLPDSNINDEFYSELIYYPCEPGVALIKINGGGHTWAGNKNYYPRFIVGPTAPEPNISSLIWKFFNTGNILE